MYDAVTTGFTHQSDPYDAAAELRRQLDQEALGFVLFFCSAEYDLEMLADALNQAFDTIPLAGCTTAGEITHKATPAAPSVPSAFAKTHSRLKWRWWPKWSVSH